MVLSWIQHTANVSEFSRIQEHIVMEPLSSCVQSFDPNFTSNLEVIQACSCNCALIHLQGTSCTQKYVGNTLSTFEIPPESNQSPQSCKHEGQKWIHLYE